MSILNTKLDINVNSRKQFPFDNLQLLTESPKTVKAMTPMTPSYIHAISIKMIEFPGLLRFQTGTKGKA